MGYLWEWMTVMPVMDSERWSAGQCLSGTGWWGLGDPLIRGLFF